MYYSPHNLYRLKASVPAFDENGDPIDTQSGAYEYIGQCRADFNVKGLKIKTNERDYLFSYHVIYDKSDITHGDIIRVTDSNDNIICQGKVEQVGYINYLNYGELWL